MVGEDVLSYPLTFKEFNMQLPNQGDVVFTAYGPCPWIVTNIRHNKGVTIYEITKDFKTIETTLAGIVRVVEQFNNRDYRDRKVYCS